jgi:hypothetical protein
MCKQEPNGITTGTGKALRGMSECGFFDVFVFCRRQFAAANVKRKRRPKRYLILVRHGQYDTNAMNPDDKVLTELGKYLRLWKSTGKSLRPDSNLREATG